MDSVFGPCTHDSITHDWPGFDPAVKNLNAHSGPCEDCGDASCPVGHGYKLSAYWIRAAQLAELHGFGIDVWTNDNPHGVDLRAAPDNHETWVWEFTRDDPEAIAQAQANLAHICEYRTEHGTPTTPGPPFPAAEWALPFGYGRGFTQVRSHPDLPGIEIVDAFECTPCQMSSRWRYRGLRLRSQRIEDAYTVRMWEQSSREGGEPREQPFGRRQKDSTAPIHLVLSVDRPDHPAAVAQAFFEAAAAILDPAEFDRIATAPSLGYEQYGERGVPGTPAGELIRQSEYPRPRIQLTTENWPRWLGALSDLPADAEVWLGRISSYGWADANRDTRLALASHSRADGITLTARFPRQHLGEPGWEDRLLRATREAAIATGASFAEIGYAPCYPRADGQTMLERLRYADPADSVPRSRDEMRGYSWLTVLGPELAARLGGAAALAGSGAFHEVSALEGGRLWLLATPRFAAYGPDEARAVFHALSRVLPPGRPARADSDEPHLVVLEDPQGVR
ncbi:MAG: hypothetical protein QOD41_2238 [Cryptosporangiaceae bacterium]|jgi:hypothetical protein|nr:hypothetical protein [Cryptosporangiaceae bacterium]